MKKKHICLLLCFLWMAVIFWFSHQPAQESQGLSNSVIKIIEDIFNINLLSEGGWLLDTISFLVRKAAHLSEYAFLGFLYALTLRSYGVKHPWLTAFLGVILYASSDEFHQLFITGRSGQLRDVVIDTAGGSLGLFTLWCIERVLLFFRKRKEARS